MRTLASPKSIQILMRTLVHTLEIVAAGVVRVQDQERALARALIPVDAQKGVRQNAAAHHYRRACRARHGAA